jgi:hypothetical protein
MLSAGERRFSVAEIDALSSIGLFVSFLRAIGNGINLEPLGKYAGGHLTLRGTLKASEMPRMVLVSQPGGRFTDCKR